MMITQVHVIRKNDLPAFPEFGGQELVECSLDRVAILEAGMTSGRASVGLLINLPDGRAAWVQTSARNFAMIAMAVRGACASWGEDGS